MPLLKVNQIASYSGNTLTVGTTGDTVTLATGASVSGFGFDGVVWTSNIVTSALTVSANVGYFVNTSSAAITVTLPASASNGDQLIFTDYNRTFATNALTLNPNSLKYQGGTANAIYNTNGQSITITYADSTKGWIPVVDDDVTNTQAYSIDFLVIGGGGAGGGQYVAGGGGGGGFRTSTQSVNRNTVITVTVGDGGTGNGSAGATDSTPGNSSLISGSGLTTITSAGGGFGKQDQINPGSTTTPSGAAGSGGSGGGGNGGSTNATAGNNVAGSGNTPSVSPSQGNNGGTGNNSGSPGAGGGGGAGAVGGNGSTGVAGVGGNGVASSITGSSVTYAGGGGGAGYLLSGGAGGTGGGGAANNSGSGNATAGTANLGGGGGGADSRPGPNFGGNGGKGVVILSMLTSKYSGTTTGSPTVTTSGSNTILTYTGSGSYTT
jgi:hypothetical protein